MSEAVVVELRGMPEPEPLTKVSAGGHTEVRLGRRVVFCYDDEDAALRNLAVVAITDAGTPCKEAAEVFELSVPYVSRLRGQAKVHGAAGLARRRGRPPKLSARQVMNVRRLARDGVTQLAIANRYRVSPSTICELLSKVGPAEPQDAFELAEVAVEEPDDETGTVEEEAVDDKVDVGEGSTPEETFQSPVGATAPVSASARIATGVHHSRYAGASLLYTYLDHLGAASVFSTLTGGPARRYDDLSLLAATIMAFSLGAGTVEGTKHLRRRDAGVLVGLTSICELRTWRDRLAALADGSDPLALQRAFAKQMLVADPPLSPVYYVDDHFVAYSGGRPVAKGWNTRRRHAEPGRDDTVVCDERGRPVLFASSEPTGLSKTIASVLDQLREVTGTERLLIGFDRGGSYPVCFTAIRDVAMDWVTYRRGKLAATTARPRRRWCVRDGKRVTVTLADEVVKISGYGTARQLTLYEHGAAVLQVLTSDMAANAAALLCWLRSRWRLENLFKYAAEHNGINSIASYAMDHIRDDRKTANPRRKELKELSAAAATALSDAERALAKTLTDPDIGIDEANAAIGTLSDQVHQAGAAAEEAKAALNGVPAEVPRTDIDPDAERAVMRLERRGLQMVLRLLAFNAEAWLAEHLNAYLEDPDEFRAVTRHLLHLGGSFRYEHNTITVTIDRPDSPRVASALDLLIDELNARPHPHLLGDHRSLRYTLTAP
ncbi:MAG: putative transposase [Acidimicrobiales bacterium]